MSNENNNKITLNKNILLLTNTDDIKILKMNFLYRIKSNNKYQAVCFIKRNNGNNLYTVRIPLDVLIISDPKLLFNYLEHNFLEIK